MERVRRGAVGRTPIDTGWGVRTLIAMFRSWRIGRLLGFPIEVSASFLLLLGVVLVWMGGLVGLFAVALTFSSVVAHELGHAVVARRLGVPVSSIGLHFFGGAAQLAGTPRRAKDEIAIAAAGPAVSLVLAAVGLGLGHLTGAWLVSLVGWINLVLAIFNLVPALPMDGGRILRALLTYRLDYVRATDVAVTVARVVAVGFVALGMVGGNLQLVLLAPLLWVMGSRERAMARMLGPRAYGRRRHADDDVLVPGPWGQPPVRRIVVRTVGGRWIIETR